MRSLFSLLARTDEEENEKVYSNLVCATRPVFNRSLHQTWLMLTELCCEISLA